MEVLRHHRSFASVSTNWPSTNFSTMNIHRQTWVTGSCFVRLRHAITHAARQRAVMSSDVSIPVTSSPAPAAGSGSCLCRFPAQALAGPAPGSSSPASRPPCSVPCGGNQLVPLRVELAILPVLHSDPPFGLGGSRFHGRNGLSERWGEQATVASPGCRGRARTCQAGAWNRPSPCQRTFRWIVLINRHLAGTTAITGQASGHTSLITSISATGSAHGAGRRESGSTRIGRPT